MKPGDPTLVPLGRRTPSSGTPEQLAPEQSTGKVYLETYGCQMNVADSDMLVGILSRAGYTRTTRPDDADVILINTCAVREKAEDRVLARAQELGAQKRRRRGVVLGIAGCMAEHLKERLIARVPGLDIVAGPDSYRRMPELVAQARSAPSDEPVVDVRLDKAETYDGLSGAVGGDGVSGFVTIQRGCDKFCTFCVVPFTRGRERGTPPREILRHVRAYVDAGYREVVLLGQTVNSYRYPAAESPGDDVGFADLLRTVAKVDGLERIRFTSPYPVDFNADVIDAIATEPKVCGYVHLPVQSGSDAVLARMRRGYTVAEFHAIVDSLRARVPDIAISTDILSGFCGETEEDHEATLELMRTVRFDSAFMFVYSERDMTFAAKQLADDVPEEARKRRIHEIVELQQDISLEKYTARIGRTERVMIHAPSKRNPDELLARTDGFKGVIIPGDSGAIGDLVDVTIERATMATLFGRPA